MSDADRLAELFLASLDASLQASLGAKPHLEEALGDLLAQCRAAWPGLRVAAGDFMPYLAARVPPDADVDDPFGGLQPTDLYLACACSRSDPHAIAAFETRHFPDVEAALRHLRATGDQQEEVKQALRAQLFVGVQGDRPTITTYSGRGPLSGWIRVAAVRAGCRLINREQRAGAGHEDLLTEVPTPEAGPELEYLKAKYRREFKQAFTDSVGSLDAHERILLRLHYVDGLSIDEVGELYRVHRATIARRIAKARDKILSRTRRAMMQQLRIPREEQESVMRLIQSQLRVSLSGCLPQVDALDLPVPPA